MISLILDRRTRIERVMAHINISPVPPGGSAAMDDTSTAFNQAIAGLHAVIDNSDRHCVGKTTAHLGGEFDASKGASGK